MLLYFTFFHIIYMYKNKMTAGGDCMSYYILPDFRAEYFHDKKRGICRKNMFSKTEPELVVEKGADGFGLYADDSVHIICADDKNNIICSSAGKPPATLIPGREGVRPYGFSIVKSGGGYSMLYKTDYGNETLLFYCGLGGAEKPFAVDRLSAPEYFAGGGKVFYSTGGTLGCRSVLSGGVGAFERLCEGGRYPYSAELRSKKYIVYVHDKNIIVNGTAVTSDNYCEQPVIFHAGGKFYLQWRSGDFVRYMTSLNGAIWSAPMRYIGRERPYSLITIASRGGTYSCYGFGGSPLTSGRQPSVGDAVRESLFYSELSEIKRQLEIIKDEISQLRE